MTNDSKISALIQLLDDPDDFIFNEVKTQLLTYGDAVIPLLEDYWEQNPLEAEALSRIEDIIQEIQHGGVKSALKEWSSQIDPDLLEGVLLINQFQYPDLDVQIIKDKIEQIRRDVWIELHNGLTSFEKVNVINQVIFDIHGFGGNKQNYHSPTNSYLSDVIESKKGNPISLSVIYLLVAQDLGLPIYGVNLPSHFVLCFLDENNINPSVDENKQDEVLMYINPFSRGTIFNRKEIERFLNQLNIPIKEDYFVPCTNKDIIKRVINNLIYSFQKQGNTEKVDQLISLKEVLNS